MDDTNAETIIENLNILGKLQQNQKMRTKNGRMVMESAYWFVQLMYRNWYGETKEGFADAVTKLVSDAQHLMDKAIRFHREHANEVFDPFDPTTPQAKNIRFVERLVAALQNSVPGIQNSKTTYSGSPDVTERIATQIGRIQTILQQAEYALRQHQETQRSHLAVAAVEPRHHQQQQQAGQFFSGRSDRSDIRLEDDGDSLGFPPAPPLHDDSEDDATM